ncbi:hypothetical protein ACHAWF_007846 [Thalassiosira exigua]
MGNGDIMAMAEPQQQRPPPSDGDGVDAHLAAGGVVGGGGAGVGGIAPRLRSVLAAQSRTLRLFLTHPPTRTPVIVMYVGTLGGSLHHAVTSYFYLAVGATETDIGHFGGVMSAGALIGAPLAGAALDKYGPWIPISVTAGCCAAGCLWRGMATSLWQLRVGAILLGIGNNLWTVVLGHTVKSFSPSLRSEILSGFGVQLTSIQLVGKGLFPAVEYALHRWLGIEDVLTRYRIHMGTCTFFCFYGVFALFWDRNNVVRSGEARDRKGSGTAKYGTKDSDVEDDDDPEEGGRQKNVAEEVELVTVTDVIESSTDSFLDEPEPAEPLVDRLKSVTIVADGGPNASKNRHLAMTLTLTFSLLLQSVATTVLTVLWPLLAKDRFDLSARSFGVITFASSVGSTMAVASFPSVERSERVGGRVRCAAWGFGVGSVLCLVFCACTFGELEFWGGPAWIEPGAIGVRGATATGARVLESSDLLQTLRSRRRLWSHAAAATAFQASLCFLEPSLKSVYSLAATHPSSSSPSSTHPASSSSLGGTVGFMQTLGSAGGMLGNLAGTWAYKLSKERDVDRGTGGYGAWASGGSLPFVATAILMAATCAAVWRLEEPLHLPPTLTGRGGAESGGRDVDADQTAEENPPRGGPTTDSQGQLPDGCRLTMLRETTYDLKLD